MATDSVMGLFADPQQIQQAQQQAALQRGIQLAELDPFQRASAQLYQGGYMAGGAIGSALGAEDPQLKMATARRQIMQGIDQTDPQSLAQAAQALNQAGDVQGARALAQAAQEAALKQSQITRNMREGRAAANKVVEANGRQYLVNAVTGERIADLGAASDKSTKVTVSPQIKLPADINALASGYEKAIEGDVSVKNLAGTAKGLINQATTSNNPSAWEAARTQVAKAVGEGKLSNEDIARTGIDPTLIGGVRDWIDKKVVGVPDVKTQQALYAVASYLENTASGRISEKRNNRIKMAQQVNPDVNAAEMFPDYSGAVQTPAGGGKIVDFKDFGKKAP
jgi:hypothetical protein